MRQKNPWLILLLLICLPLQSMAAVTLSCVHNQDFHAQTCQHEYAQHCCEHHQNTDDTNHDTCANCLTCQLSAGYGFLLALPQPVFVPAALEHNLERAARFPEAIPSTLLRPPRISIA